ncbi:hypothetical protein MUP77_23870, partial [Candidatus Bathyarchaeota archaeon]|nr:hypothetical protein [Candidatus Bathyarchaeota archaeon]
ILFFYSTLQEESGWSVYIIGYFENLRIYDCRKLDKSEIYNLHQEGFASNAHLKRSDPSVDLLIKGGAGSRLLHKAFPLAEKISKLTLRPSLRSIVRTATGKNIRPGSPWFRWTLTCERPAELLEMIECHERAGSRTLVNRKTRC